MYLEKTLGIIKPDAMQAGLSGDILSAIQKAGLVLKAVKMIVLSPKQAALFYQEHAEKPFFSELVNFLSSGPIMALVLEGENAVRRYRTLMGATDPQKADPGTLRAAFATSIGRNAVHGSDSLESAARELAFFFAAMEYVPV